MKFPMVSDMVEFLNHNYNTLLDPIAVNAQCKLHFCNLGLNLGAISLNSVKLEFFFLNSLPLLKGRF